MLCINLEQELRPVKDIKQKSKVGLHIRTVYRYDGTTTIDTAIITVIVVYLCQRFYRQ